MNENIHPKRHTIRKDLCFGLGLAAVAAGLSVWQVQRYYHKETLIAAWTAAEKSPPLSLKDLNPAELAAGRRVDISEGRRLERHLPMPTGTPVTAVIAGQNALFIRGEGTHCTLRSFPGKPSWYLPKNDPKTNTWVFLEPEAMAHALHLPSETVIVPFYGICAPYAAPNWHQHHLGYALTWAVLALVGLVMTFLRLKASKTT